MMPSAPVIVHPQLQTIARELESASAHVARFGRVAPEIFGRRPGDKMWSAAECVTHLSLTTRAFLPLMVNAMSEGPGKKVPPTHRYRPGFMGGALAWLLQPPYRLRMPTTQPFVPIQTGTRDEVIGEFAELQGALLDQLQRCDGRELERLRVVSPFNANVRYNLYAAFEIMVAHEKRHLWQADRAIQSAGGNPA